jgi:hypothetical protein
MFYKKEEYWYYWFKSDKDKFYFWPFESVFFKWDNLGNFDFSFIENLKSYKHLVGKWQENLYIFEYKEKGLELISSLNIKNT